MTLISNASSGTINFTGTSFLQVTDIGYRNLIGNPALDLWQRGTSFSSLGAGTNYCADRFALVTNGSSFSNNVAQASTDPSDFPTLGQVGTVLQYSLKVTVGTAKAVLASTDYVVLRTNLIGYDFSIINKRAFVLSFWVKSSATGTYSASLMNASNTESISKSYTINSANTWEKKTLAFDFTSSAGTYDLTTGAGLKVSFTLSAGTSQLQSDGVFFSGESYGVTGQSNFTDTASKTWQITAIQLETGSNASAFERRPVKVEVDNARLYYQKWTATNHNAVGMGYLSSTTNARISAAFSSPMRVAPTVTFGGTASNFKVANNSSTGDSSNAAPTAVSTDTQSILFQFTTGTSWTGSTGQGCVGLLTTDATIALDAEF